MFNKKLVLFSIFLIALLSLSVVSAEESITDLDDYSGNIVGLDNVDDSSLSTSDCDDNFDLELKATDSDDLETSSVEIQEDSLENSADELVSVKSEDLLGASVDSEDALQASDDYCSGSIKSVTAYYLAYKPVAFSWTGHFVGYFKVYKGSKLVYKSYIDDYDGSYEYTFGNSGVGTYTTKLVDSYQGVIATGKLVIKKVKPKVSVKSFTTTAGKKFTVYAYVYNKQGFDLNGGTVKFRIAGKTYKAKVKNGVAKKTIRVPKKAKTYRCKATYLGTKNAKVSSTSFKMKVKKAPKYKVVSIPTKMSVSKYVTKKVGKYKIQTFKFKHSFTTLCVFLYKNGKMKYSSQYLSKVHYKYNGKWYWTKWMRGNTDCTYHKYNIDNSVKVGKVKVKYRVA